MRCTRPRSCRGAHDSSAGACSASCVVLQRTARHRGVSANGGQTHMLPGGR
jgi:hypothetical protein